MPSSLWSSSKKPITTPASIGAICATSGSGRYGTGDRWFGGATAATSAYYTLYDTRDTPYIFSDDVQVQGESLAAAAATPT